MAEVNARMDRWRDMGYKVALWRDGAGPVFEWGAEIADLLIHHPVYPGYARVVNHLSRMVFERDQACDFVVATGDDTDPDPTKRADEIARECSDYFRQSANLFDLRTTIAGRDTFGAMQPTGDPWRDTQGRIIERIAGSPWLGREWCRRANKGQGPFWPEFTHMFGDEHLQRYAQHLGVFWQRPDLIHFHDHAQRDQMSPPAPHMTKWNTPQHWQRSKAIFDRLITGNFEECAPIL